MSLKIASHARTTMKYPCSHHVLFSSNSRIFTFEQRLFGYMLVIYYTSF